MYVLKAVNPGPSRCLFLLLNKENSKLKSGELLPVFGIAGALDLYL
jgi:hypothetical protein